MSGGYPAAKPSEIKAAEERLFCYRWAVRGFSEAEIAESTVSAAERGELPEAMTRSQVRHRINEGLAESKRLLDATRDKYAAKQMEALDDLRTKLWVAADQGEVQSVGELRKIIDTQNRILGLYVRQMHVTMDAPVADIAESVRAAKLAAIAAENDQDQPTE
jgi:hypothetical protein